MKCKVLINIHEGTIHVEGDVNFVKAVYADFKDLIIDMMKSTPQPRCDANCYSVKESSNKPKVKKRSHSKRQSSSKTQNAKINPDNPTLDKNLNTTGVDEYYAQYIPKNHSEKILIFMRFLKDEAKIENPNTDQIYTCYHAVGEKPAAAFAQSFRDTSSKKFGYIEYKSASDINLTFMGNRHFDHDLKKKDDE